MRRDRARSDEINRDYRTRFKIIFASYKRNLFYTPSIYFLSKDQAAKSACHIRSVSHGNVATISLINDTWRVAA